MKVLLGLKMHLLMTPILAEDYGKLFAEMTEEFDGKMDSLQQ